jgi:hypothetical protein
MQQTDKTSERKVTKKQEYVSPSLTTYGGIAKLTQGSFSVGADGGVGMMNKMCL